MPPEILLVDSDEPHRESLAAPLRRAGYAVEIIAHGDAVGHISREAMSRYAAIVVAFTDEPSTLSAAHQMGEYVVYFIEQLCPEVLPRVIGVLREGAVAGGETRSRLLAEPMDEDVLLAAIRGDDAR